MAYRYGIGDVVRFTDRNGMAREGVVKYAGYVDGHWIQDEYGRPGVTVEVPVDSSRGIAHLYCFALASEMTVVGGERAE